MSAGAASEDTLDLAKLTAERPAAPVASEAPTVVVPASPPGRPLGQLVSRARGFLGRAPGARRILGKQAGDKPRRPWRKMSFRAEGSFAPVTTVVAEPAIPAPPPRHKKSWREQRWERRRRRRVFEEVLGWILVPLILITGYWGVKSGLNALGTTPTALIQGIKTAISSRS